MKIGILGHGSIGNRHAANARTLGHEVKVYDPAMIGGSDFKFERDLYDWCDAAVISTPTPFHEGLMRACIERGKHALVEKPISIDIGRLPELLDLADEKKLVVMMGNNLRFHLGVRCAKAWVGTHKPIWASFICATEMIRNAQDGVILSTGAHEVDLAMHLLGPVAHVAGASATFLPEDMADFTLAHESGARSTFHLDFKTEHRVREFWVATESGNLRIDLNARTSWHPETMRGEYLGGSYDNDYLTEMRSFISRIEGDDVAGATGRDGLETLRVLLDVKTKAAFP